MHAPSDSSLLWDGVRVMTRLLEQAITIPRAPAIVWRNHRRLAKKRALAIQYSRGKARKAKLYCDLISATRATVGTLQHAAQRLTACVSIEAELWRSQLRHYLPLIERVIDQAERRVLAGEAVPAGEKLVSLFEPHADIIVKGGRDVQYGHKINLATGRSGLILDAVVEAGMPNASCPCSSATSPVTARRRDRSRATAAMPASTTSPRQRPGASRMSPSTRSAASPSKPWSRAAGCIASCAASGPASRPISPA